MNSAAPIGSTTQQFDRQYVRPNDFEIVAAWLHGRVPAPPHAPGDGTVTPRQAFENAILPALLDPPCYIAFSGGRDSSAILAAATDLARRHGLPAPVPMTEIYQDVPESDESEWQHLLISHLKLHDWLRIEFLEGNDYLGPQASSSLRSRGLIWPPALHAKAAVLDRLGGGSLLTGEGGDEVLGRRRGAQVSRLWRRGKRPDLVALRSAAGSLAPESVRRRRLRASLDESAMQPWLSPAVRDHNHQLLAADWASEPLSTAGSLEWLLTRRSSVTAAQNFRAFAAEYGLALHQPFLDVSFIRTFAVLAGRWGFPSRTDAMHALFADLLPRQLIERRSKAYFNRVFMGEHTRGFAREWTGSGVDPQLVDLERLRAEWLSEMPSAISSTLLQAAWLSTTETASDRASSDASPTSSADSRRKGKRS